LTSRHIAADRRIEVGDLSFTCRSGQVSPEFGRGAGEVDPGRRRSDPVEQTGWAGRVAEHGGLQFWASRQHGEHDLDVVERVHVAD